MAMPDQWTEIAYVSISRADESTEYQFGAITDTIDVAWGAHDIEAVPTISGGRVIKATPMEPTEITMEVFPVGMSCGAPPNGLYAWFMGLSGTAVTGIVQRPKSSRSVTDKMYRVCILWTTLDPTSVTDASAGIASADSFRVSFWNCYLTECSMAFTDDILKATVKFKCPPFNRTPSGLIKAEQADNTTLTTLGAYSGIAPT